MPGKGLWLSHEVKEFTAIPEEEHPITWKCYSCGNEEGFHEVVYDTPNGRDYDTGCNECHSVNTAQWGEGEPECDECGYYGWYCWKCSIFTCTECFKQVKVDEEPEDYLCKECL